MTNVHVCLFFFLLFFLVSYKNHFFVGKQLLITTDIASSDSSDSSNGDDDDDGSVQIGLMAGEEGLLPEKCVKLTSSGVGMEVMYAGDADYSNYIGQEIELMIIMKNSMVYTISFV